MSDTHVRILRLMAEHSRLKLTDHDAERTGSTIARTGSTIATAFGLRRRRLVNAVRRTGAQVDRAEARRRDRAASRPQASSAGRGTP